MAYEISNEKSKHDTRTNGESMKKIISYIIELILIFSLCSCNSITKQDTDQNDDSDFMVANPADNATDDSSDESTFDESPSKNNVSEDPVIGITISLGVYEQDNDLDNGKEAIEWEVIAIDDDMALVVSKYALDVKAYNANDSDVTWETCTLRDWLNGSFFDDAFSEVEKTLILERLVKADSNPTYDTSAGNDTIDKVFILSASEYSTYYPKDARKGYAPTAYAQENGSHVYTSGHCIVWLRTPGKYSNSACWLFASAGVEDDGKYVNAPNVAVCPAMWIDYAEYQK